MTLCLLTVLGKLYSKSLICNIMWTDRVGVTYFLLYIYIYSIFLILIKIKLINFKLCISTI